MCEHLSPESMILQIPVTHLSENINYSINSVILEEHFMNYTSKYAGYSSLGPVDYFFIFSIDIDRSYAMNGVTAFKTITLGIDIVEIFFYFQFVLVFCVFFNTMVY